MNVVVPVAFAAIVSVIVPIRIFPVESGLILDATPRLPGDWTPSCAELAVKLSAPNAKLPAVQGEPVFSLIAVMPAVVPEDRLALKAAAYMPPSPAISEVEVPVRVS